MALRGRTAPTLGRRRFLAGAAVVASGVPHVLRAAEHDASDIGGQTSWAVDGIPEIAALVPHVHATLQATRKAFSVNGRDVVGNSAGALYPQIYVRDLATVAHVLQFFLPPEYLRTPVEALLATQDALAAEGWPPGANSAVIDGSGRVDKATVVSDEETSLVHAAHAYFVAFGGAQWLESEVNGRQVVQRLTDALTYLRQERRWTDSELVFRGHTTDWGDVKREPGPEPTDLADGDDLTLSPYDQAWYFRALGDQAGMLEALGQDARSTEMRERAEIVRDQTIAELWQADRGHFRVHKHITPWRDPFDERLMVPVGAALAIYAGLTRPEHVSPILDSLSRARSNADTDRAGLTLQPAYPSNFFCSRSLPAGEYQNGAVWDWWAGLQIVSEFEHGRSTEALEHLVAISRSWDAAGGVHEWFHVPTGTGRGSPSFMGAAGTTAHAVIRGLFGARLHRDRFELVPRLGAGSGWLSAARPGGEALHVSQKTASDRVTISYDAPPSLRGATAVRLPDGWTEAQAALDGGPIETRHWSVGNDRYAGGWAVPGGAHSLEVTRAT